MSGCCLGDYVCYMCGSPFILGCKVERQTRKGFAVFYLCRFCKNSPEGLRLRTADLEYLRQEAVRNV